MSKDYQHRTEIGIAFSGISPKDQEQYDRLMTKANILREAADQPRAEVDKIRLESRAKDYQAEALRIIADKTLITGVAHGEEASIEIRKGRGPSGTQITTMETRGVNYPQVLPKGIEDGRRAGQEIGTGLAKFHEIIDEGTRLEAHDAYMDHLPTRSSDSLLGRAVFEITGGRFGGDKKSQDHIKIDVSERAKALTRQIQEDVAIKTTAMAEVNFRQRPVSNEEARRLVNNTVQDGGVKIDWGYDVHREYDRGNIHVSETIHVPREVVFHAHKTSVEIIAENQANAIALGDNVIEHSTKSFWEQLMGK